MVCYALNQNHSYCFTETPGMFGRDGGRKYLNQSEREAFFRVVETDPDPAGKAFCLTLFFTGCRISEALNLTVDLVDLTEKALVFRTLKRRGKDHFRSVPIPDTLAVQFRQLLTTRPSDGLVWEMSRTTAYRLIKHHLAVAGIHGVKASPKGLRHGYAVACVSRNVPLTTVKKWLGHARLETTAIYLDVIGDEERELAKRLWKRA